MHPVAQLLLHLGDRAGHRTERAVVEVRHVRIEAPERTRLRPVGKVRGDLEAGHASEANRAPRPRSEPAQTSRRSTAQRLSSYRFDIWSLRSTLETCVSTVFTEMNSSEAISLYA